MNPIESLLVDGRPCSPSRFVVPEMSLSSARAEMGRHDFSIAIRPSALIECLEPAYANWVAESRRDDEICGAPQDELAAAGYPALRQMVANAALVQLVVGHYLLQESLGKWTWDGTSPIEYWLDVVTACRLDAGLIHLSGVCYGKATIAGDKI